MRVKSFDRRRAGRRAGILVVAGSLLLVACGVGVTAPTSSLADDLAVSPSAPAQEKEPASSTPKETMAPQTAPTTAPAVDRTIAPTTAPSPSVTFQGVRFDCRSTGLEDWECSSGPNTVYCSGPLNYAECSELWYPDQLSGTRLVKYSGQTYVCETYRPDCQRYNGGPLPSYIRADIWCEGQTCTEYDPSVWVEISLSLDRYLCMDTMFGLSHKDCFDYSGGAPPLSTFSPDLYCSGSDSYPECSELWYPDDLDDYETVSVGYTDYLCRDALLGSYGDMDCGTYSGGDPARVYFGSLKCSTDGFGFDCDPNYYPSDWVGYELVSISGRDHVCRSSYGGSECFAYYGGSPANAVFGSPDYYCNYSGCSRDGYP